MAGKKKGSKKDDASVDAESDDSGEDDGDKKKEKEKEEPSARAGYIGLGLVGSLVVGFDPLRDAFQGNGSFDNAIMRFLACVAVCVVGAGTIGRLIDASGPGQGDKAEAESEASHGDGGDDPENAPGQGEDGTISGGAASSSESGRQESQPLTSSEEMS